MSLLIALAFSQIEINYACKDQHIDATFKSYQEAKKYVEYFKPHHNYEIIPFLSFSKVKNE